MSRLRLLPLAAASASALLLLTTAVAFADPGLIMAMGSAGGEVSDVVVVPVSLYTLGTPPPVAGLDLVLSWDPSLARLDAVRLTPATQEWFIAANIEPGRVAVSMAALSTATATVAGVPMLDFVFTLGEAIGQTPLALSETRVFDLGQQPVEHLTAGGTLDVGIVSAGDHSVSSLKSAYARPR